MRFYILARVNENCYALTFGGLSQHNGKDDDNINNNNQPKTRGRDGGGIGEKVGRGGRGGTEAHSIKVYIN